MYLIYMYVLHICINGLQRKWSVLVLMRTVFVCICFRAMRAKDVKSLTGFFVCLFEMTTWKFWGEMARSVCFLILHLSHAMRGKDVKSLMGVGSDLSIAPLHPHDHCHPHSTSTLHLILKMQALDFLILLYADPGKRCNSISSTDPWKTVCPWDSK